MAAPESIGKAQCGCGEVVHVYLNRSGLAYFNCGECRVKYEHRSQNASRKWVEANVKKRAANDSGESPRIAEEKHAEKPAEKAAQPGGESQEKPAKKRWYEND